MLSIVTTPPAPGATLLIDAGAAFHGYASDITRTFAVGTVDDELRHMYNVVKRANEAGRHAARPGVEIQEVDRAARKITLTLERDGAVWIDAVAHPLHIEKKIVIESGEPGFSVAYTLTNTGTEPLVARFGFETNWGISGGEEPEGAYTLFAGGVLQRLNAIAAAPNAKEVAVVKEQLGRALLRTSDSLTKNGTSMRPAPPRYCGGNGVSLRRLSQVMRNDAGSWL